LAAAPGTQAGAAAPTVPPYGAVPVDLEELYARLASTELDYGDAFQGLRAAWRHGDDVYATVVLPEGTDPDRLAFHPALLDAALHPMAFTDATADGEVRLPVAWSDVSLHAAGARAIRVRLSPTGPDTVALRVTDSEGAPVADVGALTVRPTRPR